MVASLDGFIARHDGTVGWLDVSDHYESGETLTPDAISDFLRSIDCYVMGSRTYETALAFEAQGLGWAYGDTPVIVLTRRHLPKTRATVEFLSGDLTDIVHSLATRFSSVWFVGGAALSADCLRLGLADEVRCSLMPVAIGTGISFFQGLAADVPLHLLEAKAYTTGMVALRYQVRK